MTLYRHFASKDVLVAACLSELTQEFDAAWDALAGWVAESTTRLAGSSLALAG